MFTFGDADTVPASPLASAPSPVAERDLPNYTFGEDDEDEPTFTFGGNDDGVIDTPGVGSPDVPDVDIKYTFGEGASAAGGRGGARRRRRPESGGPVERGSVEEKRGSPSEGERRHRGRGEQGQGRGASRCRSRGAVPFRGAFDSRSLSFLVRGGRAGEDRHGACARRRRPESGAAAFSFGLTPAEEPKEPEKPAAAEPPPPAASAAFTFGAPAPAFGKPETEKPAKTDAAPAPAPFTFGAPVEKPASKPEEPPAKPVETPTAAPFTFGAPASTSAAPAETVPLSASAPAFTFGAVPEPKARAIPPRRPPAFAGFGAPATATKDAGA